MSIPDQKAAELEKIAKKLRYDIVTMIGAGKPGHLEVRHAPPDLLYEVRVHDAVQFVQIARVGEHDSRQPSSVERAVFSEYAPAESLNQTGENLRPFLHDFPADFVGVYDARSSSLKHAANESLA